MGCAVIYSEAALADLQEITAFIAADNADVAQRFANRLVDLAESLRSMPERGRLVKKWPGVRVVVLAPYLIFYRFERADIKVEILRFGMAREIRLAWSFDPHSRRSRTLPKAALRVNQLSTTNSQLVCSYSFTTSIRLSTSCPVNRSTATCTQ